MSKKTSSPWSKGWAKDQQVIVVYSINESGARQLVSSAANHVGQPGHRPGKAGPLDPFGTPSTTIAPRQTRPILPPPLGAQLTSGSLGAPAAARKPGTSPSPVPFGSVSLSRILRVLARTRSPQYEPLKYSFLNTLELAFGSAPLVLEAVGGGWSDSLRSVVSWIACESKRTNPIGGSDACFKIAQRISRTLHGKRARDLEAGTRAIWLSVLVPRHVSLGRVGTVVICWSVVLVVSLPVPGSGLFWEVCFCLHQETDHGDTWTSFFSISPEDLFVFPSRCPW